MNVGVSVAKQLEEITKQTRKLEEQVNQTQKIIDQCKLKNEQLTFLTLYIIFNLCSAKPNPDQSQQVSNVVVHMRTARETLSTQLENIKLVTDVSSAMHQIAYQTATTVEIIDKKISHLESQNNPQRNGNEMNPQLNSNSSYNPLTSSSVTLSRATTNPSIGYATPTPFQNDRPTSQPISFIPKNYISGTPKQSNNNFGNPISQRPAFAPVTSSSSMVSSTSRIPPNEYVPSIVSERKQFFQGGQSNSFKIDEKKS